MIRLIVFIGIVYWVVSPQPKEKVSQQTVKPKFIAEEFENDSTLQQDMYEALRDGFNINPKNLEIF